MPAHSRSRRRFVGIALIVALALGSQTVATAAAAAPISGPLPEVAALDTTAVDLSSFSGLEQDIAPFLGNLSRLANSVNDDSATNYGFINCGCWRTGQGPNDARVMENVLTLAYFYTTDRPWNPYYQDEALGLRFKAAMQFLFTRQNADGSFPQGSGDVHSRAATGFALELYELLLDLLESDTTLDPAITTSLTASLERAAWWFLEDEEVWGPRGDQFANQVIGGLVGISNLLDRFDDPALEARFRERLDEHREVSQSEAGFYRDGTVAHRYSIEVESEDLVGWGDPDTRHIIDEMQARYLDWAQYHLLYDAELDGYFINTATDSRHRGWNYADQLPIGSNHLWSGILPQAGAYGRTAEDVAAERASFAAGTWQTSVGPKIAANWAYQDPSLVRDVILAEEHYPTAEEREAAIGTLRPFAGDPYTEYRADSVLGQQFVFAKRDRYVTALSFGQHVNTQYGFWDNQRFGLNYLYDPQLGVVIQSQNAPAFGAPRTRPSSAELSWGTGRTVGGVFRIDSYDQPVPRYSVDGATVDPAQAGALDELEVTYGPADNSVQKRVTLGDDLDVAVDSSGTFFERIPLIVAGDDQLFWDDGTPLTPGQPATSDAATGIVLHRDGRSVEITWSGADGVTLRPSAFPVAGGDRTLHVLDVSASDELDYRLRIVDDACPASDASRTVFIGTNNTGVPNIEDASGCTVADLLRVDDEWDSHGDFVSHVATALTAFTKAGLLSGAQSARVVRAAAQSDIGKDLVTAQVPSTAIVAGSSLAVSVTGRHVGEVTVSGECLVAPATATGEGVVNVTTRETLLPGSCTLHIATALTSGTTEHDTLDIAIEPDVDGVVFRDSFDSAVATDAAWTSIDGIWTVAEGVYRQTDTTRTGWRSVVDDLQFTDGTVQVDLTLRSTATSSAFGGVQIRTAKPGDAYTASGYLIYARQNGSVDIFRAGQGVIASGAGAPLTGETTLRVEAAGAHIQVFVGAETTPRVSVTDPNPLPGTGYVQLITGRAAVDFDDFRVRHVG